MGLPSWVQITPSQWAAMTPEQQQQVIMQAADDTHRQSIEAATQAREQNKPPSQDEDIMAAVAGPASLLGGYYLADVLPSLSKLPSLSSLFGGGAAATGTTGVGAATGAAPFGTMLAADGTAIGTMAAPAAAGAGGAASSLMGMALPAAGIAAGGYGLYDLAANRESSDIKATGQGLASGAAAGAGIGAMFGGVGAVPGAIIGGGLGALGGLLSSNFGSGKGKDQRARDEVRKRMKDAGMISVDGNDKWNLTRADGSTYDIGTENMARPDDYQIEDFNKEGVGQTIGWTDPLAAIVTGGDKTLKEQFSGYFTNMAVGQGDARANAQNLYQQAGLDKEKAWQAVNELEAQGKIDQQTGHVYRNSLNLLFDGKDAAPTQKAAPQVLSQPQTQSNSQLLGGGVGKTGTPGALQTALQQLTPRTASAEQPKDRQLLPAIGQARPSVASKPQNLTIAEALKPKKSPQDPNGSRTGVRMNITGSPIVKQRALEYWLGRK
jgi:hypothetical protein